MVTLLLISHVAFINSDTPTTSFAIKIKEGRKYTENFCDNIEAVAHVARITMNGAFKRDKSEIVIRYRPLYDIEGGSPSSLRRYFPLTEEEQNELWKHFISFYHSKPT